MLPLRNERSPRVTCDHLNIKLNYIWQNQQNVWPSVSHLTQSSDKTFKLPLHNITGKAIGYGGKRCVKKGGGDERGGGGKEEGGGDERKGGDEEGGGDEMEGEGRR